MKQYLYGIGIGDDVVVRYDVALVTENNARAQRSLDPLSAGRWAKKSS